MKTILELSLMFFLFSCTAKCDLEKAKKEYYASNYEYAIILFKECIKDENSSKEIIYRYLGDSYRVTEHYDSSIFYYLKLFDISSELRYEDYINIGDSYFKQGVVDEAFKFFEMAVKVDAKRSEAYFNLGVFYHRKNEYEKADYYLTKALILNPEDYDVKYLSLKLKHETGTPSEVIRYATILLKEYPKDVSILFLRAVAYGQNGDFEKTIADCDTILVQEPNHYDALYNKALANKYLEKYLEACEGFNRCLEIDSSIDLKDEMDICK